MPTSSSMLKLSAGATSRRGGDVEDRLRACEEELARCEERLRESEERFRRTFDQGAVGMAHVGRDGSWLRVNDRLCQMVGYSRNEMLVRRFQDLTHPDDMPTDMVDGKLPLRDPTSLFRQEKRYLHRNGAVIWVSVTSGQVQEANGTIYMQAIIEEITERKRAEQVLRESEARKAAVLDSSQEAIFTFDHEGRIVEFNAGAERIFGRGRGTVLGRRVDDVLIPPARRAPFHEDLAELVAGRGSMLGPPFESVGQRADGSEFPVEIAIAKVDLEGPPLFTASLSDLSEKRHAEAALEESETRAQAIIDNMLGGVIMADESHRIHSVNAAAARMFGYSQSALAGRQLAAILPALGADAGSANRRCAESEPLGQVSEWWGRRQDGSAFPLELSLCAFHYQGRRYLAGNVRDLTALREVERMKQELISTVNHELRTPLTSIRGSLTLLASEVLGELPAEAAEVIALAERNCLRLIALINDILDLERLDRSPLQLRREPVPVSTLLTRSGEVVRGMADEQGVRIDLRPIPGAVLGDFDRLVQVLVNLLSNAIKFSPAGSEVTVSARALEETIELRVEDRGRGIAAADREIIFERFQQVEASDSRQKGGTGLGLAICKSIVEQLGGDIGVESEEGVGSVFWIRLAAAGR